jgi:Clostripain family
MNITTSPTPAPTPTADKKQWTVLIYSAADNNLKQDLIGNITDLEKVGSDSYTNLVAQVDTGKECNRYLLTQAAAPKPGHIDSKSVEKMGKTDMANPQTLADFIEWGIKNYPAEHYMVVVSDHGDGWQGAVEDDSAGTWMSLPQIREGFEKAQQATGKKVDIIGFDACLMASTEVADELKGVCDFQISSEETEGAAGWPYSHILNSTLLQNVQESHLLKINVDPRALAARAVHEASGTQDVLPTMTAIDSSQVGGLTQAVDGLAQAIVKTDTPTSTLSRIVNQTQEFYDYRDAIDFAQHLATNPDVKDGNLKEAARNLITAADMAIVAEEHSTQYPGAHGLTLELTTSGERRGYDQTQLAKETQWPAALAKLAHTDAAPAPTHKPTA